MGATLEKEEGSNQSEREGEAKTNARKVRVSLVASRPYMGGGVEIRGRDGGSRRGKSPF